MCRCADALGDLSGPRLEYLELLVWSMGPLISRTELALVALLVGGASDDASLANALAAFSMCPCALRKTSAGSCPGAAWVGICAYALGGLSDPTSEPLVWSAGPSGSISRAEAALRAARASDDPSLTNTMEVLSTRPCAHGSASASSSPKAVWLGRCSDASRSLADPTLEVLVVYWAIDIESCSYPACALCFG